jgi:hypothetical protein
VGKEFPCEMSGSHGGRNVGVRLGYNQQNTLSVFIYFFIYFAIYSEVVKSYKKLSLKSI